MDDWNDFGDLNPSNLHSVVSSPAPRYAESPSNSTLDTFSDSTATLLDQNGGTRSTPEEQHAELRSDMPASDSLPQRPLTTRLSSFPFFQSVRQRRADRAAAAAAAATAAAAAHAAGNSNNNNDNCVSNHSSTVADTDVDEYGRLAPFDAEIDPTTSAISDPPRNDSPAVPPQNHATSPANSPAPTAWPVDASPFDEPDAPAGHVLGDDMSAASEDDDVEPRSVMMPVTNRRAAANNPLGEDIPGSSPGRDSPDDDDLPDDARGNNSLLGFSPRRGDLDDVPDDYELNVEGFRFTAVKSTKSTSDGELEPASSAIPSSFLKYADKSYIKLEVISAKQIRGLLLFFNIFALMSIAYTLVLIVLFNTKFKQPLPMPLPLSFLPQSVQRADPAQPCYSIANEVAEVFPCSVLPPNTPHLAVRPLMSPSPFVSPSSCSHLTHTGTAKESGGKRLLAALGVYVSAGGIYASTPCPLSQGNSSADAISPRTIISPRQGGPSPSSPSGAEFGKIIIIEGTQIPVKLRIAHHTIASFLGVFFLILVVLFAIRLFAAKKRNITHEQVWTLILIIATALYFNPFENAFDLADGVRFLNPKEEDGEAFPKPLISISNFLSVVREASFMTFVYFYLWANFHSYRILDPTQRLGFVSFYLLKLLILVPILVFHITTYLLTKFSLSGVPLLSGPSFGYLVGSFKYWNYVGLEFWLSIIRTCLDFIVLVLMFREGFRTMRTLQQVPYMKYRAKRVGFRFFVYLNAVFYFLFYILYIITFFGKPKGDGIQWLSEGSRTPKAGLVFYQSAGLWPLIAGYVLSSAYVHLPYDCSGWFRGWFMSVPLGPSGSRWSFPSSNSETQSSQCNKEVVVSDIRSKAIDLPEKVSRKSPSNTWSYDDETPKSLVDNDAELQQQIIEPITYRKRESKDSLELKANCFTMQTHVIMFNFAWYVYYYGTPKLENFRPRENPLPFQFVVDKHVKSSETDTQALILNCTDRIIITFKGTTSMRNLKTSIQLNFEHLYSVIRLNADGEDELVRLKKLFGSRYMSGRLHKGFATAYKSVMDEVVSRVRALREQRPRPVFLTGHSLGGALATICSLDLWVKLKINRREIFVSTFGSPRVGNSDFAAVYREVVPLHWRIIVAPDMIAKLPRVGYKHVGKKVLLTPQGDMLIDPDALERRPWTGEAAGFAYHRKASYLLAMRAWCVRNHGLTYTPVFWPFPVRPEDERRFAGAFDPEEEHVDSLGGRKVAEKIIRLDAMVDILGEDQGLDNMAVVEKWARLTRRALLNDKLGGATNS